MTQQDPTRMDAPQLAELLQQRFNSALQKGEPHICIGPRTTQRLIALLLEIRVSKSGHKHVYQRERDGQPYYEVKIRLNKQSHKVYNGTSLEEAIKARDAFLHEHEFDRRASQIEEHEEAEHAA